MPNMKITQVWQKQTLSKPEGKLFVKIGEKVESFKTAKITPKVAEI